MAHPHFFRINCPHARLFHDAYIRCYQNNGLKVIRCFPHCCPHTEYRGCGGSLSLRVDATSVDDHKTLHAFGRFEIATEPAIASGEEVEWTFFTSDLRSKKNLSGLWLQGRLEVEETRAVVFHFNHTRTDGWHYEWKSGSSKLKRDAFHCFHVYVVHRTSETQCSMVLHAFSAPFTISSYRRAVGNKHTSPPSDCRLKPQPKASTPQSLSSDRGLKEAETIVRLLQLCAALSIDDIPPQQWTVLEATLVIRCIAWSGLHLQPPAAMQIIPDHFRQDSQKPWSLASEIALKLLWAWFDKTTFELCQQMLQAHSSASDNPRAAFEAGVEAFYDAFVTPQLANDVESLENLVPVDKATSKAESLCYSAFLSLSRESSMASAIRMPPRARVGCDGLWHVQSVHMRRMDIARPSVLSFFRFFTMVFALDVRASSQDHLFVVQSKLLLFPAPSTVFRLDGRAGILNHLPNGEACGLDQTAMVGDYKAWTEFDAIQLWIYRWPQRSGEKCYLLRVWLAPCALDPNALRISWTVEESVTTPARLKFLQAEDRMNAWDDMEHHVVLQVDTTYARVV